MRQPNFAVNPQTSPALLDQAVHRLELRVLGRAQPFKRHHFSRHQLGTGTSQPVKGSITVALGARSTGIGHDPDLKLIFQTIQCGL